MLYDFLLFIYFLINIPKLLYENFFLKKKKQNFFQRLGFKKYQFHPQNKHPIIWIHAVSLGETKAARSLVNKLKESYKNSYIIISSTTNTGHSEAIKIKKADKKVFMPFDFDLSVKRVFSQIKPDIVIFIETDLWYNFIKQAKKNKAKIFLVSAKISQRSTNRFSKLSFFSKKLFSYFDLILAQNETYFQRFIKAHVNPKKIQIGGNLKFSQTPDLLKQEEKNYWIEKLNLRNKKVITIASTHNPEESLILSKLSSLFEVFPNLKVLIAPRHPERFKVVSELLKHKNISFSSLSNIKHQTGKERVILLDTMGFLNISYQISDLAIVCGSFTDKIGGHNILEPILAKTPVMFGPFMFSQEELKKITLKHQCSIETTLDNLNNDISHFFLNEKHQHSLRENTKILSQNTKEITTQILTKITSFVKEH